MKKAERQRLIKQLIMQQEIETQDELITRLEEIGVRATQATVSRDIREMSIVNTWCRWSCQICNFFSSTRHKQ